MKIILIRHAQTVKNQLNVAQGHGDSDLTPEGVIQTEKTRDFLKNHHIDAVFCSNLGRAIKTATTIAEPHHIKIYPDDNLKELEWGEFSKYNTKELLAHWSKFYEEQLSKGIPKEQIRPENGENSYDHAKRIQIFLDKIKKSYQNKTILIVGHGGTNKVIIGLLKQVDPEQFYTVKQDNACINIIELDEKGKLLTADINNTVHLN